MVDWSMKNIEQYLPVTMDFVVQVWSLWMTCSSMTIQMIPYQRAAAIFGN